MPPPARSRSPSGPSPSRSSRPRCRQGFAPTGRIRDAADYRRRFPDGRIGSDPLSGHARGRKAALRSGGGGDFSALAGADRGRLTGARPPGFRIPSPSRYHAGRLADRRVRRSGHAPGAPNRSTRHGHRPDHAAPGAPFGGPAPPPPSLPRLGAPAPGLRGRNDPWPAGAGGFPRQLADPVQPPADFTPVCTTEFVAFARIRRRSAGPRGRASWGCRSTRSTATSPGPGRSRRSSAPRYRSRSSPTATARWRAPTAW